jgi:HAD superfamily hydrolase (TIGR01549 family)
MADTAIFDVDGTLVDTNYHHAIAWHRAMLAHDIVVPLWQIHRAIGMGGDRLVAHVAGDGVEGAIGDDIRSAWERSFDALIDEVRPFPAAHDVLGEVKERGFRLVLASSGKSKHVDVFLDLIGARELADDWTTSDDAERSKPAPDLVKIALSRVGGGSAVMVGDSTWDAVAAGRAGVPAIGVLNGGFSESELREAGAVDVFHSLADFQAALDDTLLRALSRG